MEFPTYDVVVCGGGPAGWVAAVSSARMGAKTAIIEKYGFFGGTATAGLVIPISGYYKSEKRIVGGIAWEFVEELKKYNAALVELPKGHVSVDTEYYKLISQRMVLASGVEAFTNSYITDAEVSDKCIKSVTVANKDGKQIIYGKNFIDATGDGNLCHICNVPMTVSSQNQPMSMCFELSDVDVSTLLLKDYIHHNGVNVKNSVQMDIHNYLESQYKEGLSPQFGGPWFNTTLRGNTIAVNITRNSSDCLDSKAFDYAEFQMREDMFALTELLRKKYPEFRNCHISASAVNAGVRESRHLCGQYTLSETDLISGRDFEDSIALSGHPMDIHKISSVSQDLIRTDKPGHIPYRCLYNKNFTNLLVSGRAISATSMAHASIRVQATAMALGQVCGTASCLCIQNSTDVCNLDVGILRNTLMEKGAIV